MEIKLHCGLNLLIDHEWSIRSWTVFCMHPEAFYNNRFDKLDSIYFLSCSALACLGFICWHDKFGWWWRMAWCERSAGRLEVNITRSRRDTIVGRSCVFLCRGARFTHFTGRWCVPFCNHQINFIRDKVDRVVLLFMRWTAGSIYCLERDLIGRLRILAVCLNGQRGEASLCQCHRIELSKEGIFSSFYTIHFVDTRISTVWIRQKRTPPIRNFLWRTGYKNLNGLNKAKTNPSVRNLLWRTVTSRAPRNFFQSELLIFSLISNFNWNLELSFHDKSGIVIMLTCH